MKTGIALLTGLLVVNTTATGFQLDVAGCKTQKNIQKDAFSCPCSGGSGDYDWHFTQLPAGWTAQQDKIIAPKGKFEDKKVYGAKVEVLDRRTKQSVKKSLFFNFENGKVGKIFDHDFDFDVDFLVPGAGGKSQKDWYSYGLDQDKDPRKDNIKKLFDDADGIGGGNGLNKLLPYFLGNGLYKGDDKNPYINRLPSEDEVIKIIDAGVSRDVRVLIVNAARSRANCQDISGFLEKLLQRLRTRIQSFKDDTDGAKKVVSVIQQQLKFLQTQLKEAQGSSQINLKDLQAKLKAFKDDIDKIQANRDKYQADLNLVNKNIDNLQASVATFVAQSKKIKDQDDKRIRRIDNINDEIFKLEDRIKTLKDEKAKLDKERKQFQVRLFQFKSRIDASRVKIQEAKVNANDLRLKIKRANDEIDATKGKIADLEKAIKSSSNQQRVKQIQVKIASLEKDLTDALTKLKRVEPLFKDLTDNYDDLLKVGDKNFYGCYKSLYKDDKDQFRDDNEDDDGVQFDGQQSFYDYLGKIFGNQNAGNIRPGDFGTVVVREVTNTVKTDRLKVKQTNIFTKDWAKAYGSPLDDDFDDDFVGGKFKDNDFGCDGNNGNNARGYKGSIQYIRKNVARVINDQGVQCNVYFGGCTRIQTANKRIPQAGDEIYWRGTNKKGGKNNDYNAHHVTCF